MGGELDHHLLQRCILTPNPSHIGELQRAAHLLACHRYRWDFYAEQLVGSPASGHRVKIPEVIHHRLSELVGWLAAPLGWELYPQRELFAIGVRAAEIYRHFHHSFLVGE